MILMMMMEKKLVLPDNKTASQCNKMVSKYFLLLNFKIQFLVFVVCLLAGVAGRNPHHPPPPPLNI